jgi:D-sedoheptulose 7-phosphate isomerase
VTFREVATAAFETTAALHRDWPHTHSAELTRAVAVMTDAVNRGGRILSFGNGGSATDAQHLAGELVGRFLEARRALSAIALTADSGVLTALANDDGYETVFVRQVEAHGRAGDVAVGLTTSGVSANVTQALVRARQLGLTTIALTGHDGGDAGRAAEIHLNVPSTSTPRVQEVHRTILHVMCELIEKGLR